MLKSILFTMFFCLSLGSFAHANSCTTLLAEKDAYSEFYKEDVAFNVPMSHLRMALLGTVQTRYNIIIEHPSLDMIEMFDVTNSRELYEDLNDLDATYGRKEDLEIQGELLHRPNGRTEFEYTGLVVRQVSLLTVRPVELR